MNFKTRNSKRTKIYSLAASLWKWSPILMIPICLLFIHLFWQSLDRFWTFRVRYDILHKYSLSYAIKAETRHLKDNLSLKILNNNFQNKNDNTKPLRKVELYIAESNLKKLDSNLPHSGFEYVVGGIKQDGKIERAKIRYRGDFFNHWSRFKKSLRIKTRKKKLFEGLRKFNLIAPKLHGGILYLSHAGYELSRILNLMTPKSELVTASINGENQGLYLFVEQIGETTLRKNRKMPGDIYKGEQIGKDRFIGIRNLFDFPGIWTKASINNHYPEESNRPIEALLYLLKALRNQPDEEKIEKLGEIVNFDKMSRMNVFETLCQTVHFDEGHNWRLYYDPWKTEFEPIIWDPMCFVKHWMPPKNDPPIFDLISNRHFQDILFMSGKYIRYRERYMTDFFTENLDKKFLISLKNDINKSKQAIINDPNHWIFKADELLKLNNAWHKKIKRLFASIKKEYFGSKEYVRYAIKGQEGILPLEVFGRRYVERIILEYDKTLGRFPEVKIRYTANGGDTTRNLQSKTSIQDNKIIVDVSLISGFDFSGVYRHSKPGHPVVKPAYYELLFDNKKYSKSVKNIYYKRYGSALQTAIKVKAIKKREFKNLYQVIDPASRNDPEIWQGEIKLKSVIKIKNDLVIKPGTIIKMGPNASVIIFGKLSAQGTKKKPIRIVPSHGNQAPWGTFALKGTGANGSKLRHIRFEGGSGYKGDLFEYSAMFSIHDVKDVKVENAIFKDSQIVDDMVHAVYSTIHFKDSSFLRSQADALDIDISEALIENCRFINSGNDGVDLMTSKAVIVKSRFIGSGDKGISVGEDSMLFGRNLKLQKNNIGIQSKDGSVAVLANVDILSNNKGLDAYKKNWRYDSGGEIFLYNSRLKNNQKMITSDKKSKIFVHDSYLDQPIKSNTKKKKSPRITVLSSDGVKYKKASVKKLWRFPAEIKRSDQQIQGQFFKKINPKVRGSNFAK